MKKYDIAIVGSSGAVGEEILKVLQEQNFPTNKIIPIASKKSAGKEITFQNKTFKTLGLTKDVFEKHKAHIVFFSAGGAISKDFAPIAAKSKAVVIDNSSFFRMDKNIPLVVPEVNPEDINLWKNKGIISNPNCSTIQMVQALKPLDDAFDIKRVDVSTYQAVSGAGKAGMDELVEQMKDFFNFELNNSKHNAFVHQIALNVIPHIDVFQENLYTKEEMKMVLETNKILHKDIQISATCVRVPTLRSHSESISITFKNEVNAKQAQNVLKQAKNIQVLDNPQENLYPMPIIATDTDKTYVGRIRNDIYDKNILHLWCVADQLRVGAATNAIRIAKEWIKKHT